MDATALLHAKARFTKVQRANELLKSATTFDEIESAWSDFLTACATIYTKLEQGAKANPKSVFWFGQIKRVRKTDPLLQYIHQARNSDEHGILNITKRASTNFVFPKALTMQNLRLTGFTLDPGAEIKGLEVFTEDGKALSLEALKKEDVVALVPVINYGTVYNPPVSHLSQTFNRTYTRKNFGACYSIPCCNSLRRRSNLWVCLCFRKHSYIDFEHQFRQRPA